jgi:hypothetical protein
MHTYTVQVFRGNGFWILEVPELRAVGQARALSKAEPAGRSNGPGRDIRAGTTTTEGLIAPGWRGAAARIVA